MGQKSNKILKQSGVIPYRLQDGKLEVLLITNRKHQKWVLPKGGIVTGMTPPDSAAKEAWEEAGIYGKVKSKKIGCYKYRKKGKTYRVHMYPLSVESLCENYPEAGQRLRVWVDINEAIAKIELRSLQRIIKRVCESRHEFF